MIINIDNQPHSAKSPNNINKQHFNPAPSQQILQRSMEKLQENILECPQVENNHHQNYNQNNRGNNQIRQEAPPNKIIIISGGQNIEVSGTQGVILINQNKKQTQNTSWVRQERIGCCCFSAYHQSFCFDYRCISKCCRSIQGFNLCCYCPNMDCIYCCIHHACRSCCFQKDCCQCMYELCSRMPLCMLLNCLKNCGFGQLLCGCGAKVCACLLNLGGCFCRIIGNCQCICQIAQGCKCCSDIFCIVVDILCCLCK